MHNGSEFAFGAKCPVFDADYRTDDIGDFDNFIAQSMCEVASILSISAGKQISVAMTVEKLVREIQSDEHYKYLRQQMASKVPTIFVGELAQYNYCKDNLLVSERGLLMYKGYRFLVPNALRAGLL